MAEIAHASDNRQFVGLSRHSVGQICRAALHWQAAVHRSPQSQLDQFRQRRRRRTAASSLATQNDRLNQTSRRVSRALTFELHHDSVSYAVTCHLVSVYGERQLSGPTNSHCAYAQGGGSRGIKSSRIRYYSSPLEVLQWSFDAPIELVEHHGQRMQSHADGFGLLIYVQRFALTLQLVGGSM